MKILTPNEINQILAVTDAIGIHREAVVVQLGYTPGGIVRLWAQKKVDITAPADRPLDEWLKELPSAIRSLDLSSVRRI